MMNGEKSMGMFDTVLVPCPTCGEELEFQSKGGDCNLDIYTLDAVPYAVLMDINRHSPHICNKCKTKVYVEVTYKKPTIKPAIWKEEYGNEY